MTIFCVGVFLRWVCEEIPDLKLAMENYVLIDYDTKRWAFSHIKIYTSIMIFKNVNVTVDVIVS